MLHFVLHLFNTVKQVTLPAKPITGQQQGSAGLTGGENKEEEKRRAEEQRVRKGYREWDTRDQTPSRGVRKK